MSGPRLTPAQVAVLRELRNPSNQAWLAADHISQKVSWRIARRKRHVTSTVKSLIKCGMLHTPNGMVASISEIGRAYLAQLDAQK